MRDRFFWTDLRVHWADTDAAGIVWFGNFFRYFEAAEDELFRALGRTRLELIAELDILMPRVDLTCRFRSPARAEDLLTIGIAVDSVAERRVEYRFEAREKQSGRLVAEGAYRVACVAKDGFKAIDFPQSIRRVLAGFETVARAFEPA